MLFLWCAGWLQIWASALYALGILGEPRDNLLPCLGQFDVLPIPERFEYSIEMYFYPV
jgi:hypothetical protein